MHKHVLHNQQAKLFFIQACQGNQAQEGTFKFEQISFLYNWPSNEVFYKGTNAEVLHVWLVSQNCLNVSKKP